jgi:tetratricopeptide (TPR) repeat protein
MFQKAVRLQQKGKSREAERLYETILHISPHHFGSLHYLGLIRAQQNKYDDAISLLRRALQQDPKSADVHVNLAVVFETVGRPEDAIKQCREALAIKSDYAEAHFTAGNAYKALNRLQEATDHFLTAIAIRPGYSEAYYNLGNTFSAVKLYDQALECYGKAIAFRPRYSKAFNNRGKSLQESSRHLEALKDFDQAIDIQPTYFEALVNRGNTLVQLERLKEALASFDRALSIGPDAVRAVYGPDRATPIGTQPYKSKGRLFGEAIAHHGKAMALRPLNLNKSTEYLKQTLLRLVDAGFLSARDQSSTPPRYPSDIYPDALRAVMRCLDAAGIEAFLTGGTLLGAMRDSQFITFDKDLDFGVRGTVTLADLSRALAADSDFELSGHYEDDALLIAYFWRGKVAIDFFRFFFESDRVWCGFYLGGHLMKWLHTPFDLVEFKWQDVTVKIPADSGRFLTEVYGDWRTPKPYFGLFASPNIEGGYPPISRNVAYSAIAQALSRSQITKATDLCRQALEFDPDDSLIQKLLDGLTRVGPRSVMTLSNSLGNTVEDSPG